MRSSVIFTLFFMLSIPGMAQNTGFAGKRVLVKLDAYNSVINKFPNFGAEFIATRGLTLSAELNMGKSSVKQTYYFPHPYHYAPSLLEGDYSKEKTPDKALVSHTTAVFSLRKYLGSKKLIPAPYGAFFSVGFRKGVIKEINGQARENLFKSVPSYSGNFIDYSARNISYYGFQAGFGSQYFIRSRFSIDFLLGLNYNRFNLNLGAMGNEAVSGATGNFGPNVFRIFTNKENRDIKSYNVGLFLNLSVGVIIF